MMRRSDPIDRTGRDSESDLLTDAQLAVRWQLSRGTLANQRSQGRGPAYLKFGRPGPIPTLRYRSLRTGRIRVAGISRNCISR
jgi:hypothetical protein